jgi:uncharacterized protein YceK
MKRFIIVGLMLAFLSGCATVGVVNKPSEEITASDKKEVASEWWEIFSTILSLLPKGW